MQYSGRGPHDHNAGGECVGFSKGGAGAIQGNIVALKAQETDEIIAARTILRSSAPNPIKKRRVGSAVVATQQAALTALVRLGATTRWASPAGCTTKRNWPVVGVPKTIDNDLSCTDFTFGFGHLDQLVMEPVDRLRTTAESHRPRVVIETMGRHAGWIACLPASPPPPISR